MSADAEATRHRVEMGLRLLREAELDPAGFVPPGYACTRALREVHSGPSLEWFADWGGVDTRRHGRIRARALCLGTSTPLRRAVSPAFVRAGAHGRGELIRLDIHPADFDLPSHVAAIERVLQRARGRRAVTYDELGTAGDARVGIGGVL